MLLSTYLIIAVCAFLLVVVTLEFKKIIFLSLAGSAVLIILGIIGLSAPLTEITGATTTLLGSDSVSVNVYTPINYNLSLIISWAVMLSGFLGIIKFAIDNFQQKNAEYEKTHMQFQ